jgi:hypothetical protein
MIDVHDFREELTAEHAIPVPCSSFLFWTVVIVEDHEPTYDQIRDDLIEARLPPTMYVPWGPINDHSVDGIGKGPRLVRRVPAAEMRLPSQGPEAGLKHTRAEVAVS